VDEGPIRALCEAGDFDGAATAAIKGYGPEILGFLVALHRSEQDASDVFSIVTENLWKGLPAFSWTSSLRTWAYTIARNASYRFSKGVRRDAKARVALDDDSNVGAIAAKVRTETLTYLRTAQKDKFTALRETLPPEDQMLLILRVDRKLPWQELARILAEGEEIDVEKEAARLRKRFQLVKEKLLEMGKKAGLVKNDND
jgi:RNA polymerase sigma-70 factor (ECF subfamily)